jgi:hypothetical protein
MRSKDKIDVVVEPMTFNRNGKSASKRWMKIRIKRGQELVPSFEDWFRMIQALSYCEREKYKSLPDPLEMPKRFFMRCFDEGITWEQIRDEFNIPQR